MLWSSLNKNLYIISRVLIEFNWGIGHRQILQTYFSNLFWFAKDQFLSKTWKHPLWCSVTDMAFIHTVGKISECWWLPVSSGVWILMISPQGWERENNVKYLFKRHSGVLQNMLGGNGRREDRKHMETPSVVGQQSRKKCQTGDTHTRTYKHDVKKLASTNRLQ